MAMTGLTALEAMRKQQEYEMDYRMRKQMEEMMRQQMMIPPQYLGIDWASNEEPKKAEKKEVKTKPNKLLLLLEK
jgi:superfamily II DNA or RNA helicase